MEEQQDWLNPLKLLSVASKAVPAVKYATGLVGVAAALLIIRGLMPDMEIAGILPLLVGTIVAMTALLLLSAAASGPAKSRSGPAIMLLWATCLFVIAFMFFTVSAVAFGWPDRWARLVLPEQAVDKPLIETKPRNEAESTRVLEPSEPADLASGPSAGGQSTQGQVLSQPVPAGMQPPQASLEPPPAPGPSVPPHQFGPFTLGMSAEGAKAVSADKQLHTSSNGIYVSTSVQLGNDVYNLIAFLDDGIVKRIWAERLWFANTSWSDMGTGVVYGRKENYRTVEQKCSVVDDELINYVFNTFGVTMTPQPSTISLTFEVDAACNILSADSSEQCVERGTPTVKATVLNASKPGTRITAQRTYQVVRVAGRATEWGQEIVQRSSCFVRLALDAAG